MRTKVEFGTTIRAMLRDVLQAKSTGGSHARLSRAQGELDGYLRALIDAGVFEPKELLTMINAERASAGGPALRTIDAPARDESAETRAA